MQCFGKITVLNKIRQALEKLPDVNVSTMQIKKAFGENGDADNAASKNRPHQQSAFLDVIDHAQSSRPLCRQRQAVVADR